MRIFLTGATGYIGSAVLDALVRAGHEVTALVRNTEKAARVATRCGRPVIGDLRDPGTWQDQVRGHEGCVLAAFAHGPREIEIDRQAIDTAIAALRGDPGRVVIYTSGVWVLGHTRHPAAENSVLDPASFVSWRPAHERLVLEAAGSGFRAVVVRPGIVYGGSVGIVGDMFKDACNGLMRVVGAGENHWPLVYDRDLADLYVRLLAHPEASGIYHANDEGDERVIELVDAIAAAAPRRPDVRHVPLAEARAKMGPYADALALDQVVRSPRARALGWAPLLRSVGGNAGLLLEEWRAGQEAA